MVLEAMDLSSVTRPLVDNKCKYIEPDKEALIGAQFLRYDKLWISKLRIIRLPEK